MDYETAKAVLDGIQRTVDDLDAMEDDAIDWYRAEVERLREEQAFWRDRLRIMSLKADGQHRWRLAGSEWPWLIGPDADAVVRNALEGLRTQPLPAPPAKEE